MITSVILGTRGSALALRQTEIVQSLLSDVQTEAKVYTTGGDRRSAGNLELGEGTGVFTKELEEALLKGEIHAAVHSLKDLPVQLEKNLHLVAVLQRGSAEDVLVSKFPGGLDTLPAGSCVGTGSPRRTRQLLEKRPDLKVQGIRGNVPTRIRKLRQSRELSAIVLARAGLDRLALISPEGTIQEEDDVLHTEILKGVLPAPGQGAIAVQAKSGDPDLAAIFSKIHDPDTAACVETERELLRLIGGGCQLPLGALATGGIGTLKLEAVLFDGGRLVRAEVTGSSPRETAAAAYRSMKNL